MPATKSGNNIYVTGTGNTLQSVLTDINDVNYFYSPSSGVYTLNGGSVGSVARYLYVRPGGDLTIGSSSDTSLYERLELQNGANNRTRIYVNEGGALYM